MEAPQPSVSAQDLALISAQIGRSARGVVGIAARCAGGHPNVVRTAPRLADGTPFPTLYYLTCPAAVAAVSTLESQGVMRQMTDALEQDPDLADAYRAAHQHYLAARAELGEVPEIASVSAGGMPTRVKCLHALVAHSLAAGPGVNPLGDRALQLLAPEWRPERCTA
ncbi:MAG TPA: DUF501 domain-containing protein [Beutenbergiaceae bacterium]|nr:DUF501 domain-containing protein [Beutenbergiaceae bacterium]